jgi:anti-anti-sigma factor
MESKMRVWTRRQVEDIAVVNVHGDLSFSQGSAELGLKIAELLENGVRHILLDAQHLEHIDSSGIGQLIKSFTSVTRKGGEMKLLHPNQTLQQILIVTKLTRLFDIYDNEETALESFPEPSSTPQSHHDTENTEPL